MHFSLYISVGITPKYFKYQYHLKHIYAVSQNVDKGETYCFMKRRNWTSKNNLRLGPVSKF